MFMKYLLGWLFVIIIVACTPGSLCEYEDLTSLNACSQKAIDSEDVTICESISGSIDGIDIDPEEYCLSKYFDATRDVETCYNYLEKGFCDYQYG